MAAASEEASQMVNMFLTPVKLENGHNVIIDSNRVEKSEYFIADAETIDHIGPLDNCILTDRQIDAFVSLQNSTVNESFNLNLSIPLMMQNVTSIIIDKHTPGFCEDHVVMRDSLMVDVFLTGLFAEKIKQILLFQDKGNRKFMIFLSLNSECSQKSTLSRSKSSGLNILRADLFKNNMHIKHNRWSLVFDPKPKINEFKRLAHEICVGEVRILMSPNYILNFYSTIAYENPLKYFLKITIHNRPRTTHSRITRFVPLSLMSVNKNVYLEMKNSLDLKKLSVEKQENDLEDKLKINPDILIGLPNFDSFKNFDFPIYSEDDFMTIAFIVSMNDKSKTLREREKIPIGNILASSSTINNYFNQTISMIEAQLTRQVPIEHILDIREEFIFKSAKTFKTNYHDPRMMEKRIPILTPLEMIDLYVHYNEDIKKIMEGNRHMAPTFMYDGPNSVTTSQGMMKQLPFDLQINGRLWADCYWESFNVITKLLFDEWVTILFEFSNLARNNAVSFFFKRDLYAEPAGMSKKVFDRHIDDPNFIQQREKLIRQYIVFKIFSDLMAEELNGSFLVSTFKHFEIASQLTDKIEEEINSNQKWKRIYAEELIKLDPSQKIKKICQDVYSLTPLQQIPISVILTDLCVEINIEFLNRIIWRDLHSENHGKKMLPPNIAYDFEKALKIINIMKSNQCATYSITINTKTHPEFVKYIPPKTEDSFFSSSSNPVYYNPSESLDKFFNNGESHAQSSEDAKLDDQKHHEINVKIFSLKNFNEHFKKK